MKQEVKLKVRVTAKENDLRLDKFLKLRFPEWGRNAIKKLVNSRKIVVNGRSVWLGSWQLKTNDLIKFYAVPKAKPAGFREFDPKWIIAEDDDLIAINKLSGLRSHASRAGGADNLLDLARSHWGELNLFHRLDRDTSGITLLTKNRRINQYLDKAFKSHEVEKTYLAVTSSKAQVDDQGIISSRIGNHPKRKDMRSVVGKGGQRAETRYEVIAEEAGKYLFSVHPVTGRTHQIRVHLRSLGVPILGDILYGEGKKAYPRLYLHAAKLVLPEMGDIQRREFVCLPGNDFTQQLPGKMADMIMKYLS